MSFVGWLLLGAGAYLLYWAVKGNHSAGHTPLTDITAHLKGM